MKLTPKRDRRSLVLTVVSLVMLPLLLGAGAWGIGGSTQSQTAQALSDRLYRAAVHCYAVEGRYPPTLDYLMTTYGVPVDDRYVVFYTLEASNLMPDITVMERAEEKP